MNGEAAAGLSPVLPYIDLAFARQPALWGLLLVPLLVIVIALDGQRRRRVLEAIGHLPQIRRLTASVSLPRRRLKWVMVTLAAALLVVAIARPQRPGQARMLPRRGLDIVVALDFSRSMLAADIYPTRLARAKLELDKLIDGLKGDRVGLVAFAGVTLSYPLTSDYSAAKLFWRDLQPSDIPVGGTDLGEAVRAGLDLIARAHEHEPGRRKPAQLILLLTDGADTEGGAAEAARQAAQQGVKIFPVGIGSRAGEVVVLERKGDGSADYVTDAQGAPVRMELDEPMLRQLATLTGGEYFPFDAERFGVERVQKAIAGLERKEEEGRVVREPDEAYGLFAGAALALLALELLLGDRRRRGAAAATTSSEGRPVQSAARAVREPTRERLRAGPGATAALLLLVPWLGGWSWFERPSPDVAEGNRKLAAGKPDEALAAYERALGGRPDDLAIHYDRGAALYALGRLPEAMREFERATESPDPKLRADAWYNLGNARLKQQSAPEAIDAYKRALRLRPDDRRAKWNLELALRQQQQQKQQSKDGKDDDKKDGKDDADSPDRKDSKDSKDDKDDKDKKDNQDGPDPKDPQQQMSDHGSDGKPKDARGEDKPAADPQQKPGAKDDGKQGQQSPDKKQQQQQQQQQQAQQGKGADAQSGSPGARPEASKDRGPPGPQVAAGEQLPEDGKPAEPQRGERAGALRPARDIDKQDAEAVLDAFERVEPTVQKDLARRRAGNRRPRKDW